MLRPKQKAAQTHKEKIKKHMPKEGRRTKCLLSWLRYLLINLEMQIEYDLIAPR